MKSPTVTGVVIESSAPSPGIMTGTPDPGANSSSTSASVVPVAPVAPVAPVVVTRKQTVSYSTPEADASVEFDVTITDGIITAASSKTLATKDSTKYNQDRFTKALSSSVVGKKAKDLKVDAIGGASLTTAAFLDFVHSL